MGFIIVGLVILREHVYYMRMQTVGIVDAYIDSVGSNIMVECIDAFNVLA